MATGAAWSNKLRSFLTILGVMVGVCAVIAMASVIDGLNLAVEGEIDDMGNNIIVVDRYGPRIDYDNLTEEERNRPFPTADEAQVIKDNCPSVDGVAPQNHYWAPGGNVAKYKNRKFTNLRYNGTWPDLLSVAARLCKD